jgi:coenzyme F420-reducing hydrogenase gamma subunit
MIKPKIAIYDLTDCEGCEVKLVSLRERLLQIEKKVDIVNWRLSQESFQSGPYDITIIEGTPITDYEVKLLKDLRQNSKILVALGTCASLGGIPAIMPEKDRKMWYEKIYTSQYHPRGIDAVPLSAYVPVDFSIHGCPVDEDEVVRAVEELLSGKKPSYRGYSVCFECKIADNKCRIAEENKPCLGPITQGGCKAVCVSGGSPCYGCFGVREEANIPAMIKTLERITDKAEIERYLTMFHNRNKEINDKKYDNK